MAAEVDKAVIVYLNDRVNGDQQANDDAYAQQKQLGGKWIAHFLAYQTGDATSWVRHPSELLGSEALTPLDILHATEEAVRERLGIETPEVEYVAPAVGTLHGVQVNKF